uniref:Arginine deiminase n=1 Tax=Eutreptiella gymnastica TaxID=73025 RepID=A0A7S4CSE2_9EUGL
MVHYPGAEMVFGSYHPMGALYHEAVSITKARQAIKSLTDSLAKCKVDVLSVGDILRIGTGLDDRQKLEEFAMSSITYDTTATALTAAEANLMSTEYKRKAVEQLDTFDLIDAIITRPSLTLEKSTRNTPLTSTAYNFSPLTNLVFTRDQQVVTAKGVVLSQLYSKQRAPEVHLIQFCLEKLGIPILGQIPPPGKLEGGDFLPAGKDLCFIGLGIRTNSRAIAHMLHNQWFGTERVAVVKDLLDRKQLRMHLDCVFNIAGDDVCVLMDSIIGDKSSAYRLVDEYTLVEGEYRKTQENVEFGAYLNSVGYHIIPVTDRMHNNYGVNFINCGNSRLITTDAETADHISKSPCFNGSIDNIDFQEITKLYGALHCSTQVFREGRNRTMPKPPRASDPLMLATQLSSSPAATLPPVRQTTNWCLVVAPTYFAQNPETFQDNAFMQTKAAQTMTSLEIVEQACTAFAALYSALKSNGVNVKLFHHEAYHDTPDAVFPNNWFSTHSDSSSLVLYPMKYPSRQRERRGSMMHFLKGQYSNVVDMTSHEDDEDAAVTKALEGTGAMVLDRVNKVAFCALSQRADSSVLEEWCNRLGYKPVTFETKEAIYHTNVMMSIGTSMAVVCADSIVDGDRARVLGELKKCGKMIIKASEEQMAAFLCNCIELRNNDDQKLLFMSEEANNSLTENQMYHILQHVDKIVPVEFSIIEKVAGGGVRCAIGELF